MMGYMANPDLGAEHVKEIDAKNNDAIDSEGWLHSGDKGAMDARGGWVGGWAGVCVCA